MPTGHTNTLCPRWQLLLHMCMVACTVSAIAQLDIPSAAFSLHIELRYTGVTASPLACSWESMVTLGARRSQAITLA